MSQPPAKKLVVVGQGYVGLPLAMRGVAVGLNVVGFDINEDRVMRLSRGESYVEDIPDDEIANALKSGKYLATTELEDCSDFDVAVITVPTPLRESAPDLSYIEEAARGLSGHLKKGATVILESTTYPGTTEELLVPILEQGSGLQASSDFYVGYSPERIDPGNATWNFQNTPKVVSGINSDSLHEVDAFYSLLVDRTVPVSSTGVAELTKLLENTFRHVNIALINELAMFANQLNVSVWEAIDAASSKPFGYMTFTPGPGVGGHCLPVDPSYLSWKVKQTLGDQFRFIDLANDVNEHMPSHVVNRITGILNEKQLAVSGSRILVLGLAYKKNTGDMRESPSTAVCSSLDRLGANVRVVDSWVPSYQHVPWDRVELTDEEIAAADLVVIVTDHDDVDYERVGKLAKLVFDTRRRTPLGPTVTYL
ncbi:MAG TPA: nucleotide sugar dehydrogenase [Chloroflexota bacterium]|nr:nucleotide sugar dehydrogenase [Chloroflexota bacterium]